MFPNILAYRDSNSIEIRNECCKTMSVYVSLVRLPGQLWWHQCFCEYNLCALGCGVMVPGTDFQAVILCLFLRKVNVCHSPRGRTLTRPCLARNLITLLISESKCLHYKEAKISPVGKLAQFLLSLSSVPSIKNALSVWVILHSRNFKLFTAFLIWNQRKHTIFHATIYTVKRF